MERESAECPKTATVKTIGTDMQINFPHCDEREALAKFHLYETLCPGLVAEVFKKTGQKMELTALVGKDGKPLDLVASLAVRAQDFIALSEMWCGAISSPEEEQANIANLIAEVRALHNKLARGVSDLAAARSETAAARAELEALKEATKDVQGEIARGIAAEVVKLGIRPTALTQPRPSPAAAAPTPGAIAPRSAAILGADGKIRNADGKIRNADGTINWTAMQDASGLTPNPITNRI
jgi:hypothetical protein